MTYETNEVNLVELRAWARQSHETAKREGFPRVAGYVYSWISRLDRWQAQGVHTIELKPWADPKPRRSQWFEDHPQYVPWQEAPEMPVRARASSSTMKHRDNTPRNMNEAYKAGWAAGHEAGLADAGTVDL
jgi:hypothetical protein